MNLKGFISLQRTISLCEMTLHDAVQSLFCTGIVRFGHDCRLVWTWLAQEAPQLSHWNSRRVFLVHKHVLAVVLVSSRHSPNNNLLFCLMHTQ